MSRSSPPTARSPLVIAVAGRKGGVGKTTVSAGLLSVFHAKKNTKVLGIDLDPQSNLAFGLGADPNPRGQTTVELLLQMKPEPQHITEGFDVFPGNQGLTGQQVQDLHPEDLGDIIATLPYDVIVLDCPPGHERLEHQALAAADVALIVLDAHPFAMVGAQRVYRQLLDTHTKSRRGPPPDRWAFVMSRLDERRRSDRELGQTLATSNPAVARFEIRQDSALSSASTEGRHVMDVCPTARGVEDLQVLAKWCARR